MQGSRYKTRTVGAEATGKIRRGQKAREKKIKGGPVNHNLRLKGRKESLKCLDRKQIEKNEGARAKEHKKTGGDQKKKEILSEKRGRVGN